MKTWNAWVACLGCAGLCLALVGCGGGSDVPDPESDSHAATGSIPTPEPSAPPPLAQNEPEPAPAPAETAPAPTPTPAPTAATPAAPSAPAEVASETGNPSPKTEMAAMNKAAGDAQAGAEKPPGTDVTTTATPETSAPASGAEVKLGAPPETDAMAAAAATADNPFAIFSETAAPATTTGNKSGSGAAATDPAPEGGDVANNPPAEGDRKEKGLGFLNNAGAGDRGKGSKLYHSPIGGAMAFLAAVKSKNLSKVAEATALHAPLEAKSTANQKLFAAILEGDLAQEDLDELAKKLDGYKMSGSNVPKSSGQFGVIVTKQEGTSTMVRTLLMRHEASGWKVQDISGKGEIQKQIQMPRMRGSTGGRR